MCETNEKKKKKERKKGQNRVTCAVLLNGQSVIVFFIWLKISSRRHSCTVDNFQQQINRLWYVPRDYSIPGEPQQQPHCVLNAITWRRIMTGYNTTALDHG